MKNVVIIGAGPAGLTAAYTLLNESSEYHPIIIEASEFIGGISRSAQRFSCSPMRLFIGLPSIPKPLYIKNPNRLIRKHQP